MSDIQPPVAEHWVIDKRIPLALVITIVSMVLGQTIVFTWWNATVSARVSNLEDFRAQFAPASTDHERRITILETLAVSTKEKLDKIDRKLDGLMPVR